MPEYTTPRTHTHSTDGEHGQVKIYTNLFNSSEQLITSDVYTETPDHAQVTRYNRGPRLTLKLNQMTSDFLAEEVQVKGHPKQT